MNLFGPTWLTYFGSIAIASAVSGVGAGVWMHGYVNDKASAKLLEKVEQARQVEQEWQMNLEVQNELDQEERARMAADYDRGLSRLRQRAPVRMPASAASACAGASPAQLAAPDAERLERIGRDARAVQLDLEKARHWIEEVTAR